MSVRYERRWLAECVQPENNHDKFYEIFFIDAPMGGEYTVVFHWGRRGGRANLADPEEHDGTPAEQRPLPEDWKEYAREHAAE